MLTAAIVIMVWLYLMFCWGVAEAGAGEEDWGIDWYISVVVFTPFVLPFEAGRAVGEWGRRRDRRSMNAPTVEPGRDG